MASRPRERVVLAPSADGIGPLCTPMGGADPADAHWGFTTRLPSLREAARAVARGEPSPVPAALAASSTFACPGAPAAMAAAYGMRDGLVGLASTRAPEGDPDAGALDRLRSTLRASLDTAWAVDACRRGDAAADKGDAAGAAALYSEALALDPGCPPALAGRAALAERDRRLHDALDGFRAAAAAGWAGGGAAAARVGARLAALGIPSARGGILTERLVGVDDKGRRRRRSRSRSRSPRRRAREAAAGDGRRG